MIYYDGAADPLPDGNYDTWNVQLEPGTVATPYEAILIQTQLANCQRYFVATSGIRGMMRFHGYDKSTYADPIPVNYPTQMRITPTSYTNITGTIINDQGNSQSSTMELDMLSGGVDRGYMYVKTKDDSQPTAGTYVRIEGGAVHIDAEL